MVNEVQRKTMDENKVISSSGQMEELSKCTVRGSSWCHTWSLFRTFRGAIPVQEEKIQAGESAQSQEQIRAAEADPIELV